MDQDNQNKELKTEKKEISATEQQVKFENEPAVKEKEISPEEKNVADQLRKEIELMKLDPELEKEAENKAKEMEFLGEADKIEYILQVARQREDPVLAVKLAIKTKDPFILDIVHDTLAKEGYYKNFMK